MPDIIEEIADLTQTNGERLNRLATMHQIGFDMTQLTLRHLVLTLFPTEDDRQQLDLSFQKMLAEQLDHAEANVDRINLERSAQTGGLIVPGAPAG